MEGRRTHQRGHSPVVVQREERQRDHSMVEGHHIQLQGQLGGHHRAEEAQEARVLHQTKKRGHLLEEQQEQQEHRVGPVVSAVHHTELVDPGLVVRHTSVVGSVVLVVHRMEQVALD